MGEFDYLRCRSCNRLLTNRIMKKTGRCKCGGRMTSPALTTRFQRFYVWLLRR